MDARVVTLRRGAARAVAFEETALAPRTGAARKVTREERAAVVAAIVSVVEWRVQSTMGADNDRILYKWRSLTSLSPSSLFRVSLGPADVTPIGKRR
jgi:hypothetical protein